MSILVTGAKGFLGGFLCKKLKERGVHDVTELPGSTESWALDLTKRENVKHILEVYKPKTIIHLAARVGGIGANKKNPGAFFYENMSMGLNLIEEARQIECEKFVLLSTVCAYPKFTPVPFTENHLWDGYPEETNAPYGIAKKALMEMLQAYRKQYGFNGITLMPVNMYGPKDNFNPASSHVIPALINKIQRAIYHQENFIEVWGSGEASREFLYVEDCADAIVKATLSYNNPYPVNIGVGKEIKIKDLVTLLCSLMGYPGDIVFDSSKPDGQPRRCLDISKAKEEFGFEAQTSLEEGLIRTIKWYRNKK